MSDITDRVKKIVVEHLNVDESKVSDEASNLKSLEKYSDVNKHINNMERINLGLSDIFF